MNYSGIDLICDVFNRTPELKNNNNFSYFLYDYSFPKISSDLDKNAEPYVLSPRSNIIAHFDNDIIHNLLKPQKPFFSFNKTEKYESLESNKNKRKLKK